MSERLTDEERRAALWAQFAAAALTGLYADDPADAAGAEVLGICVPSYPARAATAADTLLAEYDKRFGGE